MLKTLLGSVREYKKASILAPLFVAAEVCVECTIPFITAKLVNNIESGCDMPFLLYSFLRIRKESEARSLLFHS